MNKDRFSTDLNVACYVWAWWHGRNDEQRVETLLTLTCYVWAWWHGRNDEQRETLLTLTMLRMGMVAWEKR